MTGGSAPIPGRYAHQVHVVCNASGSRDLRGHVMQSYLFPKGLKFNANSYIEVVDMMVKSWNDRVAQYLFHIPLTCGVS